MPDPFQDVEIVDESELPDPREYLADIPAKLISGILGLMGFMTACIVGLAAGNTAIVILLRAILAMFACAIIGRVLGVVGEICAREFMDKYKADNPRPEKPQQLLDLDREMREHEEAVQSMKKAA